MISPDDPRLTAYASGDLPPEEAARLETELAADPTAREHVAQLRALQNELSAVFAAETAAEQVQIFGRVVEFPETATPTIALSQNWQLPSWFAPLVTAACLILIAGAVFAPPVGIVRESARRSVASSNLRQIGQSSLIYASDHKDALPVADNLWDYAGALARDGGLNDATIWVTGTDPANVNQYSRISTVLTPDRTALEPAFRELKPSWAVPLGEITVNMPATTPIAWTRGLKPDGTWSKHSPYGTDGGHVVFLGGKVVFYRNTKDAFNRFDGKGATSNILEALPPGTRPGEYVPTEVEQFSWAVKNAIRPIIYPGVWTICFLVLGIQAVRRKWPTWLFVLFVTASFVIAIICMATDRVRE